MIPRTRVRFEAECNRDAVHCQRNVRLGCPSRVRWGSGHILQEQAVADRKRVEQFTVFNGKAEAEMSEIVAVFGLTMV
jgi:hypothetical protein